MPESSPTTTRTGVPFTLNGRPASAEKGELLISAAERAGVYIPRFCYHPRMKPVGMCRMCLVEVSGPRGATLQPACFVPVTEDMEVDTTSDKVKKAQDGVLEFLLVNHPLDCPVCDKGGECPLQDQTLAYGPGESRYVEEKRHFEKPIPISELVLLDRERCIQCARCTRFAEEVAGEALIDFAGRGEQVEVATFPTRPFSSYFSGNTVQICPVGALTASPYRFTARPWDLDQVESTCTTCALGCRVAVQSSANRVTRLLGIDSEPVNHGWLCDKGRFVFEAVNGDEVTAAAQFAGEARERVPVVDGDGTRDEAANRLTEPLVRKAGALVPASWGEALGAAATALREARDAGDPVALLGGARLTNEAAYAFARLAKGVLGTDDVDAQLGDGLPADLLLSLPRATVDEACHAEVVLTLAGDLREELPVLFLRLREAVVEGDTRVIELAARPSALTPYATSLPVRPGDAPALARVLVGAATTADLPTHPEGPAAPAESIDRAKSLLVEATATSPAGDGVVIVLGRPSLAESAAVVAEAAAVLAEVLPGARFLPALRRGNVMGALDMGLAPGLLPGRTDLERGGPWFAGAWGSVPASRGRDADGILAAAAEGRMGALLLVGCDPLTDYPDAATARKALDGAGAVIAVAGHRSASTDLADVVLPSAVAHEGPGTTTNIEGRVSRLGQKLVPPGLAWPDWMIATELCDALGTDTGIDSVAELWDEIERIAPAYAGITRQVLESDPMHDGLLVPLERNGAAPAVPAPVDPMALPGVESVERQGAPPRIGLAGPEENGHASAAARNDRRPSLLEGLPAGRAGAGDDAHVPPPDNYSLRLVATRRLYDGGSAVRNSPSLAPLAPAVEARANPYDLDRLGATTGQPVRVRSTRGSLELPAHADEGIPRGVVAIDFNLGGDGNAAATLIEAGAPVTDVRLESVQ
jgi:NADH-quinone oxidoreductase subunit G